jgi:hypothetical protein
MRVAAILGAAMVILFAIGTFGYISFHHGDVSAYQSFFSVAVAPFLASIATLFMIGKNNDKTAQIQKQTNGITSAHQDIIQNTLPALTQEVSDLKKVVTTVIAKYPQVGAVIIKEAPELGKMIENLAKREYDQWR